MCKQACRTFLLWRTWPSQKTRNERTETGSMLETHNKKKLTQNSNCSQVNLRRRRTNQVKLAGCFCCGCWCPSFDSSWVAGIAIVVVVAVFVNIVHIPIPESCFGCTTNTSWWKPSRFSLVVWFNSKLSFAFNVYELKPKREDVRQARFFWFSLCLCVFQDSVLLCVCLASVLQCVVMVLVVFERKKLCVSSH